MACRRYKPSRLPALRIAAVAAAAGGLAACSGGENGSAGPQIGLSCVDDSAHCISQRGKVFDSYMADKSRSFVKQPATADSYASGVRLFAISKRRKELTCDELAHAKREADAGPSVLRSNANRLTPAQVARGVILANEVSRELGREQSKRCRKT